MTGDRANKRPASDDADAAHDAPADAMSDFGLDALPLSDGAAVEAWWAAPATIRGQHPFECEALERYRQAQLVGLGGMGKVSAVSDVRLNRQVALKEVGDHQMEVESLERRLAQEAWITAQLEHPGIVPIYDAGRGANGRLFFTMRLIRGRSLAQTLKDGDLAQATLLRHFLAVCQAMAYAHDVGVIHRDLKPANIMLGAFGETQVMDWGLARQLTPGAGRDAEGSSGLDTLGGAPLADTPGEVNLTAVGTRVGTPAYMSPEQARAHPAGPPSDVFGLGAILFEILAGRSLFVGLDSAEIYRCLERGAIPRLADLANTAPAELHAIVERSLSPAPGDRYPEAGALAADVAAYLDGRRVEAHTYSTLELTQRFVRAFRLPLAIAGAALVGLAVVFGVSYSQTLDERDRAQRAETEARASEAAAKAALGRAQRAETESGRAQALASANYAQRLILKAHEANRNGFQPESEILASAVLAQQESPAARALLSRFWARSKPQIEAMVAAPQCHIWAVSADGESVLCREDGQIELRHVSDPHRPVWRRASDLTDFLFIDDSIGLATNTIGRHPTEIVSLSTGAAVGTFPASIHYKQHCHSAGRVLFEVDGHWTLWTAKKNHFRSVAGPADEGCVMSGDGRWAVGIKRAVQRFGPSLMVPFLIDLASGEARPLPGIGDVRKMVGAMNADGSATAWVDTAGRLQVFGVDGKRRWDYPIASREVKDLRWAPRGQLLAALDERGWATMWDVDRRTAIGMPRRPTRRLRWSQRDTLTRLALFEPGAGAGIHRVVAPAEPAAASIDALGPVAQLALSQDGRQLIITSGKTMAFVGTDGKAAGTHTFRRKGVEFAATFVGGRSDRSVLTSGFPKVLTTRNGDGSTTDTGARMSYRWLFPAGEGGVMAVGYRGNVVYRPAEGESQSIRLPGATLMLAAAASRDGRRFAFITSEGLVTWAQIGTDDTLSEGLRFAETQAYNRIALDDSGKTLVLGGGDTVTVFDLSNRTKRMELSPTPSELTAVAVTKSGWVAAGTELGELVVWDAAGTLRFSGTAHGDKVTGLAWGPRGHDLYTAALDGKVIRWGLSHLTYGGPTLVQRTQQAWGISVQDALQADLRP